MDESSTNSEEVEEQDEQNGLDARELDTAPLLPMATSVDEMMAEETAVSSESAQPPTEEEPAETMPIIGPGAAKVADDYEQGMKVAKRCQVGAVRERNEDSCLVFMSETGGHFPILPFGLYIVADGMGGHQNGHVASKTASRTAARNIINRIYLPLLQLEGASNQAPIQEVMEDAVTKAHFTLYDPEVDNDSGTTLTIALVLGRRLYVAHVGDSRIYMFANNKLEKVTTDHSLVQRLQEVGQLTAEEASFYQYRHVLLRALGQGDEIEVDTFTRSLPKEGKLLLCTDGLCGTVPDSEIQMIMQQELPVQDIADQLYEAAMDAGGYDNITAIVVEFRF